MMKGTMTLISAGTLVVAAVAVQAGVVPPSGSKPLSEIIKSVENQAGTITQAEFDNGMWEIEAHKGTNETTFYLDPKTGKLIRQTSSIDAHEALPPAGSMALSAIVKSLEDQKVGTISEIEFDDGFWEATIHKDGKKSKMHIDPKSGKPRGQ